MVTLHRGKHYILNNERIVPAGGPAAGMAAEAATNPAEADSAALSQEEGRKQTLTWKVLENHNHSGDMEHLQIRFDSMGVYDNTYVGILQTAYASGLKEFPMPCVFTNCHNCLGAVGGTINTDVHKYAESACKKSGGIFVPPHEAVIHQYMREMIINSGDMSIVSDSHTRYGTQGSLSIGEGGPELAKAMLGKYYEIDYPEVIAVFLTGTPKPWVGPMDVALSIIGKVFRNNFVKNKVLEFVGPGLKSLSMDFRNGIDTMTTESACLSSIWATDERTREYFEIHNRPEGYRKMKPGNAALYDGVVEVNLDSVVPMIALPFHPSNAYPLADVIADPEYYLGLVEAEAGKVFENNPDIRLDLKSKIVDGKIKVDQAAIAGCAAGSFENICAVDQIARKLDNGLGTFPLNIYPASQPIMYELNRAGVLNDLMGYGARVKTAFCGPCFGASDAPGNNDFCIRHSTRNFPNREGSNPATGQIASVALMDSRSIAATAFNGGYLTSAETCPVEFEIPEYHFNGKIYENIVYNGFGKAKPETEIVYGPSIKDWPEMSGLTENLLLKVASVIRDEVTTTDELIPSGETASHRSNPYKISEYTLIRKDPAYVGNAKAMQVYEKARINGDRNKTAEFYRVLKSAGVETPVEELMGNTGIGTVLYAKRPGDGSAREYAASCQKVLGGLANICIEYATKRYRSNCVNWGILPFTSPEPEISLAVGEYVYLPGIRRAVEEGATAVEATVIGTDGSTRKMELELKDVTEAEKKVLLAGSLINFYKEA
ncbi:hydratase [Enterocloster asparagiformis]|uniref:hydratase n=1 Tax=Enterocloster asparagiformis TaxID=333367 RepID=UPI0004662010|nr:hydratase [Enterocloster asparagiformis]